MIVDRRGFVKLAGGALGAALLAGCSGAQDGTEAVGRADEGAGSSAAADYEVEYGESEVYSQEDMDAAIAVIMAEFGGWEGCAMQSISFTDDVLCEEDLDYVNELREEGAPEFTQAIVFSSNFHSPSEEQSEGTAWEPDTDYDGWTWHLGRTDGGDWQLMTWGYA